MKNLVIIFILLVLINNDIISYESALIIFFVQFILFMVFTDKRKLYYDN